MTNHEENMKMLLDKVADLLRDAINHYDHGGSTTDFYADVVMAFNGIAAYGNEEE